MNAKGANAQEMMAASVTCFFVHKGPPMPGIIQECRDPKESKLRPRSPGLTVQGNQSALTFLMRQNDQGSPSYSEKLYTTHESI